MQGMEDAIDIQREQIQRMREFLGPTPDAKAERPPSTITFSNPAAEQFFVDGTTIPEGWGTLTLPPFQLTTLQ